MTKLVISDDMTGMRKAKRKLGFMSTLEKIDGRPRMNATKPENLIKTNSSSLNVFQLGFAFCFCNVIKSARTQKLCPDVAQQFIETLFLRAPMSCDLPYWNDSRSTTLDELYVRGGDVAIVEARVFSVEIVGDLLRQHADHRLIVDGNRFEQIICFLHD